MDADLFVNPSIDLPFHVEAHIRQLFTDQSSSQHADSGSSAQSRCAHRKVQQAGDDAERGNARRPKGNEPCKAGSPFTQAAAMLFHQ
ncbi:hypothetical protein PPGU19_061780 (plasmid) [Paraburkholderia sp. PGU19]|nr:hypothetical protein PPGU19_061780 [Paraburkholderia sp. PGU19]